VALSKDVRKRVKGRARGEGAKIGEKEELVGEFSEAMRAHGRDPKPIREAMGV
jgi:hypothetical protein